MPEGVCDRVPAVREDESVFDELPGGCVRLCDDEPLNDAVADVGADKVLPEKDEVAVVPEAVRPENENEADGDSRVFVSSPVSLIEPLPERGSIVREIDEVELCVLVDAFRDAENVAEALRSTREKERLREARLGLTVREEDTCAARFLETVFPVLVIDGLPRDGDSVEVTVADSVEDLDLGCIVRVMEYDSDKDRGATETVKVVVKDC